MHPMNISPDCIKELSIDNNVHQLFDIGMPDSIFTKRSLMEKLEVFETSLNIVLVATQFRAKIIPPDDFV